MKAIENKFFKKSVIIYVTLPEVWKALTEPELIKRWMSDPEIDILTNWELDSPFIIRGNLHGTDFENIGKVLQFEKEKILSYNHLSSISELPGEEKNYSTLEFDLSPEQDHVLLTLTITGFPTETIFKHLEFYWSVTLIELKKFVELTSKASSTS